MVWFLQQLNTCIRQRTPSLTGATLSFLTIWSLQVLLSRRAGNQTRAGCSFLLSMGSQQLQQHPWKFCSCIKEKTATKNAAAFLIAKTSYPPADTDDIFWVASNLFLTHSGPLSQENSWVAYEGLLFPSLLPLVSSLEPGITNLTNPNALETACCRIFDHTVRLLFAEKTETKPKTCFQL